MTTSPTTSKRKRAAEAAISAALSVVFYGVVKPASFALSIARVDLMKKKWDERKRTYFTETGNE